MRESYRCIFDPIHGDVINDSPVAIWGTAERVNTRTRIHAFLSHEDGGFVALCGVTRSPSLMEPRRGQLICAACDFREAEMRRRLKPALPVITMQPKFESGAIRRRSLQRAEQS